MTRFDRAHFHSFGEYDLKFEIVYYVLDPDYNKYMDIQQSINLSIYQKFEFENIEFAFPTQTIDFRAGDSKKFRKTYSLQHSKIQKKTYIMLFLQVLNYISARQKTGSAVEWFCWAVYRQAIDNVMESWREYHYCRSIDFMEILYRS